MRVEGSEPGPATEADRGTSLFMNDAALAAESDVARLDVLARGPTLQRIPRCDPLSPIRMVGDARKVITPGLVGGPMGTGLRKLHIPAARGLYADNVARMARTAAVEGADPDRALRVRRRRGIGPCRCAAPDVRLIDEGFCGLLVSGMSALL